MSTISTSAEGRDSLGGSKDSSQTTSYGLSSEQPEPTPMPKGYGTVTLPHLLGQSGLARLVVAEGERGRERSRNRRERRDMVEAKIWCWWFLEFIIRVGSRYRRSLPPFLS